MERIWANRLIGGTKVWSDVPKNRRDAVMAILKQDVKSGINGMTAERYLEITGKVYEEVE
jgi:hypothetical protein